MSPFKTVHKSTQQPNFNDEEFYKALSLAAETNIFPSVSWRYISEYEIVNSTHWLAAIATGRIPNHTCVPPSPVSRYKKQGEYTKH